jgi:hypothetical protein
MPTTSSTFSPTTGIRENPLRRPGPAPAARSCALDPDHVGAGHHHLAGDGVAELEHRLDHLALAVLDHAALLGHVDQLAQLDLGGERALAEALAGRQRVAEQDQQAEASGLKMRPSRRTGRPTSAIRTGAGGRGCAGRPR